MPDRGRRGKGCMPQMPLSRLGLMPPPIAVSNHEGCENDKNSGKVIKEGKGQEVQRTKNYVAAMQMN